MPLAIIQNRWDHLVHKNPEKSIGWRRKEFRKSVTHTCVHTHTHTVFQFVTILRFRNHWCCSPYFKSGEHWPLLWHQKTEWFPIGNDNLWAAAWQAPEAGSLCIFCKLLIGCCCRHPRPLNRQWRGCRERKDKLATETHERNKTKCLKGTDVNLGKGKREKERGRERQKEAGRCEGGREEREGKRIWEFRGLEYMVETQRKDMDDQVEGLAKDQSKYSNSTHSDTKILG